jgi:hypothetical protein
MPIKVLLSTDECNISKNFMLARLAFQKLDHTGYEDEE